MPGADRLPRIPQLGRTALQPAAARSSLSAAARAVGGPLAAAASLTLGALSITTPPPAPIETDPAPAVAQERITDAPAAIPAVSRISPPAAAAGSASTATGGSASLPEDGSTLRRLRVLQADTAPAPRLDRVEQAAHVEARQWDGAAGAPEAKAEALPVVDDGGLARLPGEGPREGGPVGDSPTTSPYATPEVGPEKNATPYQGLIDAATKLMMVAGLVLMASSLLVFIGKKLLKSLVTHAAGLAMITAGTVMAYAAMGMGAAVTALGLAILAHGQKLQGLIFTASGAALTFGAYKAAQGDRKAKRDAEAAEKNAAKAHGDPARGKTEVDRVKASPDSAGDAKAKVEAALAKARAKPVELVPSKLPDRLEITGPQMEIHTDPIVVDGGLAPRVEMIPSELPTKLNLETPPLEVVTSDIKYGDVVSNSASTPASAPSAPSPAGGSYQLGGQDVDAGLRNYADPNLPNTWRSSYMDRWDSDILSAAQEKGVPPNLIQGVIEHESRGNPLAVNPQSSAQGLGQMLKAFRQDYGVANAFDPKQAINGVADALKKVYVQTGSWDKALAAYAQGPTGMAKGLGFDYAATINKLVRTVPVK